MAGYVAEYLGDRALAERELEVLLHIARGHRNQEIGKRLLISGDTVKVHVKHIMAKLGRGEFVNAASPSMAREIETPLTPVVCPDHRDLGHTATPSVMS